MAETVASADLLCRAAKATYLGILLAQLRALGAKLDLIEDLRWRRLANLIIDGATGGG